MRITRRTFLTRGSTALALAGGMIPFRALASVSLGDVQIDTLSDGHLVLPGSMVIGTAPEADAAALLAEFGLDTKEFRSDCNVTLLRDGTNTVLFDAGSGPNFQSTVGFLIDALDSLGVAPEEVTHVLFTHGHPDHLWGVLDDFDDPMFPEATYMMGEAEHAYWTDPETVNTISPERQAFAAGARRYLDAIADQLTTFADGDSPLPGITAHEFAGHSPGHMVFDIEHGGQKLSVIGDVIRDQHLAFLRPEWPSGSDQDQAAGVASRQRLLARLADEGNAFIGYHLPFPGIGTALRDGAAYRFVPA